MRLLKASCKQLIPHCPQVLPDEDDCQRLFGSIRITKYVAQENIMTMQVPRRVTHRALENYFTGFSQSKMRCGLSAELLSFLGYEAKAVSSCAKQIGLPTGFDISRG